LKLFLTRLALGYGMFVLCTTVTHQRIKLVSCSNSLKMQKVL